MLLADALQPASARARCSVPVPFQSLAFPRKRRETLEHLLGGVRRAMAARTAIGEDRFLDIGQPGLQADPVGVAERVYDFAGLHLDDSVRDAMATWAEENRAGSRGEHRYSAAEFGLTPEEIRDAFADYLDHFSGYFADR